MRAVRFDPERNVLTRMRSILIFTAAGLTITLFALTPTTTKIALAHLDGMSVGIIRTVGAAMLAIPLIALWRVQGPRNIIEWSLLVVSSLGSFAGFPLLFSIGSQRTSACHAAFIMAAMPLLTAALALTIERRLPSFLWMAGACLALAGEIALVAAQDGHQSVGPTLSGDFLVLLSCLTWAAGVVAGSRLSARITACGATFWAIALAGICLAPIAIVRARDISWHSFETVTWVAMLHVTVGATIVAYMAWFWALGSGGMARVTMVQFGQPVLGVLFAALLLGEQLTFPMSLAGLTICMGAGIAWRGAFPNPRH
jgi:drug/metabolite transporter (DMT)-like permease